MQHASSDWPPGARLRMRLLGLTVAALIVALGLGAAHTIVEIGRRDALLVQAQERVSHLNDANTLLSGQVRELIIQRDNASLQRDTQAAERYAAVWLREQQAGQIDDLRQRTLALHQQALDLEQRLEETSRQLSQAREESARQQTRALGAEVIGQTLVEIVRLDTAIAQELRVYRGHVGEMRQAQSRRDDVGFAAAAQRADQSSRRIDALFLEWDAALAKLR